MQVKNSNPYAYDNDHLNTFLRLSLGAMIIGNVGKKRKNNALLLLLFAAVVFTTKIIL